MKKLYKKLMKTSALICLLILGTGNVWGATTYTFNVNGYKLNTTETTINNLNVKMKVKTAFTYNPNTSSYGVPIPSTNILSLRPTTAGALYLRFTHEKNNGDIVTINISGVGSFEISTKASDQSNAGDVIAFKVNKGQLYDITCSETYHFNSITKIEETDILHLSDQADNSTNTSSISQNSSKKYLILDNRTLNGNSWNTFCSPLKLFSISLKSTLKCSEIYELDTYTDNTLTFKKATSITPNKPCLIKPSEDVENPLLVSTVQISTDTSQQRQESGVLSFIGVLGAENIYTENHSKFYLNNDGYLVYPTSDTGNNGKIKGFRAYFEWTGGSSGVKDMTFVFDDSETTGIKTIEHDIFDENGRVYSIDGRYMGDSTDNLSRGIYIQNGRKFVVK